MQTFGVLAALFLLSGTTVYAQTDEPHEEFSIGRVLHIVDEREDEYAGISHTVQTVIFRIESGPEKGREFTAENGVLDGRKDMALAEGERIVVNKQILADGSIRYLTQEKYRLPALGWLAILFVALSVIFGGITGLRSIVGLAVSVLILVWYVLPQIAGGGNPLIVSLLGCVMIVCTSLYFAHGFRKRTTIAFASTVVTLVLATLMSVAFVSFAKLFGMGTEESMYLQTGMLHGIDLKGLLLAGIIIGCLGVLDDITTAQTAAVDEISKANPKLSTGDLRRAGQSVGKEHIASLINTLALAYVGASLPLLLLFTTESDYPIWVTLNSEFLAEEIIRTLVGSATLLAAVPISTFFAAYFLKADFAAKPIPSTSGHSHAH